MASDLTFTGERFLPDCSGEIAMSPCPTPRSIWSCPSRPSSTCTPPGRALYRLAPRPWLDALPERL